MKDGWIRVYRKMLENPIVMKDAEHLAVWVWLLLNATHREHDSLFKGEKVTLHSGQLITGRIKVAQELKISESKVERILKTFESEHQIEQQKSNKNRLITVVNWDKYQTREQQNEQLLNNNRTTTEQQLNTYNNNKNDKNEKNDNIPPTPQRGKREKKESCVELFTRMIKESPKVLSDEVISVLHEWMEYKDQKKDKYVEGGMKTLLNQIYKAQKEYGSEAVVNCVRDSMASNYKGIILDKLAKTQMRKATTQEKTNKIIADYAKQIQEEESDEKK